MIFLAFTRVSGTDPHAVTCNVYNFATGGQNTFICDNKIHVLCSLPGHSDQCHHTKTSRTCFTQSNKFAFKFG